MSSVLTLVKGFAKEGIGNGVQAGTQMLNDHWGTCPALPHWGRASPKGSLPSSQKTPNPTVLAAILL